MTTKIHIGDCRKVLRSLPAQSVQCCVTSPPYWGLRDYGIEPVVWGGDRECEHVWGDEITLKTKSNWDTFDKYVTNGHGAVGKGKQHSGKKGTQGQFCQRCYAWRGSLGLEPTPQWYVDHIVQVMREVWRVLRDDGVLWANLGDSYAANGGSRTYGSHDGETGRGPAVGGNRKSPVNFKPKDLIGIPWRVALALQADGWYLRSAMPWVKRNPMPESVQDRPTTAHEYVFLLSKSKRYFYDGEAVRVGSQVYHRKAGGYEESRGIGIEGTGGQDGRRALGFKNNNVTTVGRNRRTSDTFYDSLDLRIEQQRAYLAHLEHIRDSGGMLLSEDDDPAALLVNTHGYGDAHFAVFPVKLIEPLIRAGSSEKGCCPECGSPWVRVTEKIITKIRKPESGVQADNARAGKVQIGGNNTGTNSLRDGFREGYNKTTGWQPICPCHAGDPIPCTILDPFVGSGTTLLVADRLGRNSVGIDLNGDYAEMAERRLLADGPMFADVRVIEA